MHLLIKASPTYESVSSFFNSFLSVILHTSDYDALLNKGWKQVNQLHVSLINRLLKPRFFVKRTLFTPQQSVQFDIQITLIIFIYFFAINKWVGCKCWFGSRVSVTEACENLHYSRINWSGSKQKLISKMAGKIVYILKSRRYIGYWKFVKGHTFVWIKINLI